MGMRIISDVDAIQYLLAIKGRFAVYAGAGVSAEAEVITAQGICEEIRDKLRPIHLPRTATPEEIARWQNTTLKWNLPARRYAACIRQAYPTKAARVDFFRSKLIGKKPGFSHHAIAMLMDGGYLRSTCITTNFDKLLESAFTQQARRECQAIRNDIETRYWRDDPGRCYAVKLHGDYDTYNILNTSDETIAISKSMSTIVKELLQDSGLLVLGTAGQEKSIYSLFDDLGREVERSRASAGSILSHGLLWGIYVGNEKPAGITREEIEGLVWSRIESEVGQDVMEMMEQLAPIGLFRFFPVWGASNFLFDLISATDDRALQGTAELYLDQKIRLRHLFSSKGLPPEAITRHLASLDQQKKKLELEVRSPYPDLAFRAVKTDGSIEVQVLYGDITRRTHMSAKDFSSLRRAVVSPEDTFLSAGGGVALRLLNKAGAPFVLNELSKFAPIVHGTVAVTSGGNLPLHYIFHAASIEIQADGSYRVSEEDVCTTMAAILSKTTALGVGALWVPLLGAGVASLKARQSLNGILRALTAWQGRLILLIFVYQEKEFARPELRECLESNLGQEYSFQSL
jgi:O-acetyl-ADP-ribose deacetylase (regulator of RNase III)